MKTKRYGEVVRRLGKAGIGMKVRKFMEPAKVPIPDGERVNIWKILKSRMIALAHADRLGDPTFQMSLDEAKSHLVAQNHLLYHYTVRNKLDPEIMKEVLLPPPEALNKKPPEPVPESLFKGIPQFDGPVSVIYPRPDKGEELVVKNLDQLDVRQMVGVAMPMAYIPVGMHIHGIEMRPGQGAKLVRARGVFAKITKKRDDRPRVAVRMPSGKEKIFDSRCRAVIGPHIAPKMMKPKFYKAGQNRWLGIRPHVRGIAKNPVDHPHGGRTNGGRPSCTPWGKPTKCGYKTVRKRRPGLKY